jgi:Pyruvoyl-dependent arginine decarboxylase (PvlArgDC)
MFPSPTKMFLTKGIGVHRHALTAFEYALRDADIEQQNLVYVSSILPPRCEVIPREAPRLARFPPCCAGPSQRADGQFMPRADEAAKTQKRTCAPI